VRAAEGGGESLLLLPIEPRTRRMRCQTMEIGRSGRGHALATRHSVETVRRAPDARQCGSVESPVGPAMGRIRPCVIKKLKCSPHIGLRF
jgi:hypothetical protein